MKSKNQDFRIQNKKELPCHLYRTRLLKLDKLVIKITLECVANCIACERRRKKYKSIINEKNKELELEDYKKLLEDSKKLGLKTVTISGGEPTMSNKCINLIKNLNLYCIINTNGFKLSEIAKKIIDYNVDEVIISIDSLNDKTHDNLRKCNGLWEKATSSIKLLDKLRNEKKSKLKIVVRSILSKYFIKELPNLIRFANELGIDDWMLDYVEADFNKKRLLPTKKEIIIFRKEILPRLITNILNENYEITKKKQLIKEAKKILYFQNMSDKNITRGIYRKKGLFNSCDYPKHFALIYPNGKVWPCIGLDYKKEDVMGNLFNQDIKNIFYGKLYRKFRKKHTSWCIYCPKQGVRFKFR
jgi:MoaA/NifB/PqqE/SkfB family radical SAM enzyme